MSPEEISATLLEVTDGFGHRSLEIFSRNPLRLGRQQTQYLGASGRKQYTIQGSDCEVVSTIEAFARAGVEHLVLVTVSSNPDDLAAEVKGLASGIMLSFR